MQNKKEFLKSYPLTISKPIELCVDEVLIDDKYITYTGKYEEFEHGEYETCEIKANTQLWGKLDPSGSVDIFQTENDNQCIESDAKAGSDFNWNYSNRPNHKNSTRPKQPKR